MVPCRDGCSWAPVVDGVYVRGMLVDLARGGQLRPNTSMISGFNLNDGALFVPGFGSLQESMTSSDLASYFAERFGEERVSALAGTFPIQAAVQPSWLSRYFYSAQECETDFSYACTAQWVSTGATAQGLSAYVYQFSEPTSGGLVLHGDEIGYVFGTLRTPSAQQAAVSNIAMTFWANFAKTGNPNGPGLPSWPIWNGSAAILNMSSSPVVAHTPNDSFLGCALFESNWDFYAGCLPPAFSQSPLQGQGTSSFVDELHV
ncbi:unnamed protein product [Polarella glacialis]|uniref:Carboxylesterase type B domain-containing protein n=1 Tax=Polarella glacialis TaxID=89957 RepID=A0A813FRG9_POLGL|nr:unnamed protein product [Polarella glacialis]CAE8733916.1 unnamed protein product [Polarella glacialis]